jgi:hypothetical protein
MANSGFIGLLELDGTFLAQAPSPLAVEGKIFVREDNRSFEIDTQSRTLYVKQDPRTRSVD